MSDSNMPRGADDVRAVVREGYAKVATGGGGCCSPSGADSAEARARRTAEKIGYTPAQIEAAPDGANLGLGCGNPTAIANLQPGEVVVDLGSGAGFDALIAAPIVGPEGRVIGVDMTPEMLERARINAVEAGLARTVEFREGIIEDLPVASESADVVISNCVVNLSPDKPRAFREAFRVLKSGGRLAVSDIVLSEPLPEPVRDLVSTYVACISGALVADEYLGAIRDAGFVDIEVQPTPAASLFDASNDPSVAQAVECFGSEPVKAIASTLFSYRIQARKP